MQEIFGKDATPYTVYVRRAEIDGVLIEAQTWTTNGLLDNEHGPAVIVREVESGRVMLQQFYENDQLHRKDSPASISYDAFTKTEEWYLRGALHNTKGPARTKTDIHSNILFLKEWVQNGAHHRGGNRPAIVGWHRRTGKLISEEFYEDGLQTRISGPSSIFYDQNSGQVVQEIYRVQGVLTRADGPAIIKYDTKGHVVGESFYIDGVIQQQLHSPNGIELG